MLYEDGSINSKTTGRYNKVVVKKNLKEKKIIILMMSKNIYELDNRETAIELTNGRYFVRWR